MSVLSAYMHHVGTGAYGSQKKGLDPLQQKLTVLMSCVVGAGNQT